MKLNFLSLKVPIFILRCNQMTIAQDITALVWFEMWVQP